MSGFSQVCAAVERATPVRTRLETKLKADCPVCNRKRRLEVVDGKSGRVLVHCHGGCATEAVLQRLGLPWSALFDDVSYAAPQPRTAEQLVLGAFGDRWTLTTHDFGTDFDLAIAVECVEYTIAARYRVRGDLRRSTGRRMDWWEFPLTAAYMQKAAWKRGHRVGEHRAARMIKKVVAVGLIEPVGSINVVRKDSSRAMTVYKLTDAAWARISYFGRTEVHEIEDDATCLLPDAATLNSLSAGAGTSRAPEAVNPSFAASARPSDGPAGACRSGARAS